MSTGVDYLLFPANFNFHSKNHKAKKIIKNNFKMASNADNDIKYNVSSALVSSNLTLSL